MGRGLNLKKYILLMFIDVRTGIVQSEFEQLKSDGTGQIEGHVQFYGPQRLGYVLPLCSSPA